MGLILRTALLTDLGLRRANNEDAAFVGDRLLAVADGMGGAPAGELASELAIRALARFDGPPTAGPHRATANNQAADRAAADQAAEAGSVRAVASDLAGVLRAGFDTATESIKAAADEDAMRDGMGTTVTALLFGSDRVALMHIGDSRGYLFRDGVLTQLTRDDTFVQALVDQGVLTAEKARNHPQRSVVTKAMQGQPVEPFSMTLPIRSGDVFLLCSDGLSDVVADGMIAALLGSRRDLDSCAASLVAAAVEAGGPDNVTVLLAEVRATG